MDEQLSACFLATGSKMDYLLREARLLGGLTPSVTRVEALEQLFAVSHQRLAHLRRETQAGRRR